MPDARKLIVQRTATATNLNVIISDLACLGIGVLYLSGVAISNASGAQADLCFC